MARWAHLAGGLLLVSAGVLAARRRRQAMPARVSHRELPEWISDVPVGPDGRAPLEALLDETLADSFPASDPPSYWRGPPAAA
jgi:hypothetical protein